MALLIDSLQAFAEDSPSAVGVLDGGGRLVYANKAFAEGLASRGRLRPGTALMDVPMPGGLAEALGAAAERVSGGGRGEEFSWRQDGDGSGRGYWCRLAALRGGDGQALVAVEVRDDADAAELRRELEVARRGRRESDATRERWRALLFNVIEQLPIFVYMQRRDYTVAYANRKARNFYGEAKGRLCYEVFSGRDTPCPFCPTFRVFETGAPEDWHFTDLDGRTFHIYDFPFEDEDGEPLVMELGIDVTELKRVEKELVQAHKMRAIGVLAGGIAHDLNNNLVPVIFNIDYALSQELPEAGETREALGEALKAAYRAAGLVEQVLEYSRQQNVSRSPLQLIPLTREHLQLFAPTMPPSVTLHENYAAAKDTIVANPAQVQQLLLNLCRNAVQAMGDGGELRLTVDSVEVKSRKYAPHSALSLGEYVVLQVRDTGCGMDPEQVERIFEPFFTTKKKKGGTGMGLAVVHAIVTSNGGVIHVESTPGEGSEFTVYLPAAEPMDAPIVAQPSISSGGTGRILLVDDDRGALQAMVRMLRQAGFEVTTAESGEEGLERSAAGTFDLIIADQSMPGMSGLDMARRILSQDADKQVIICTGHVGPNLEKEAEEAGVAGFALKPMTPRTLIETVKRYCRS